MYEQLSTTSVSVFNQTVLMAAESDINKLSVNPAQNKAISHTDSTNELEKVYRSSYSALVNSARILVDDLSTASDVVHEAFVKALVLQPRFEKNDAYAYMKMAVMNQARSTLRKRSTSRKHLTSVAIDSNDIAQKEVDELPIDSQIIQQALSRLSQRQRECVMLNHTYSMTHKDISLLLRISEGSVKQHLSRGLKKLSDSLKDAR